MRLLPVCALTVLTWLAASAASAKLPFTADALLKLQRIDDPALSPDAKLVAFTVATPDVPNNVKLNQIYVVSIDGGPPRKLTFEGTSNTRPRWSPDSKRIFFLSNRKDGTQVWSMDLNGGDQKQVTTVATEADGELVSPDGKLLLFKSDAYPECDAPDAKPGEIFDDACNRRKRAAEANSKVEVREYTQLLYRHWTEYSGTRRTHILIQSLETGAVRDLTPGPLKVPPFSLEGPEPYAFSPDSTQIAYEANTDPIAANSTNSDLFTVPVAGGDAKRITANPGADEGPVYSPDGKYLAYRTQTRAGYESDQWKLAILDLQAGTMTTPGDSLDRWVESYTWSSDSRRIFFTTDDRGTQPVLMINLDGAGLRTIAQGPTSISDVQVSADNKLMIYLEDSGSKPAEIYKALSSGGAEIPLTHLNDGLLSQYQVTPFESVNVDAADGAKVEAFIVKPPDFNPASKYPVLIQIHGGPEGAWGENWTYRWNAQVFAAAGFVVVLPNPPGSTGYGQAYTDAVNANWGGAPYDDIMAVTDYASNLPYADKDRMVAAGGSYGGYMVDWILGHTDRFKALVSHAGVYDLRSEAGETEELWFPRWEFQGMPWENPELYDKWSPSMFVKQFKTPTLVTAGELDYRVPIGQSEQLFTALQEMNVPSKLIEYPDEGHWILKPGNSLFWYNSVIDWLTHYTQPLPQTH